MKTYTTGGLAKAAGVGIHTVRYYMRRGLLNPSAHRPSGYGVFTEHDVRRLELIIDAKSRGLTLAEIEQMLELLQNPATACQQMVEFYRGKVAELDRKIQELTEFRDRLAEGIEKCGSAGAGERCDQLVHQIDIVNRGVRAGGLD